MAKGWSLALVGGLVGGLVALGGAGLWWWQGRPTRLTQRATVASPRAEPPSPTPTGGGRTLTAGQPHREQEAMALIKSLYQSLSDKDWVQARLAFTAALQDQFDPAFFAQFQRVTVQDLRVTGGTDGQLELTGRNTYFYANGDTQEEERRYTVIWHNQQPLISDSRFLRVLKPR
ncbi:MAG: hypothetical protein Q6K81_04020 [Gloeomargarita sp. DG02_5_bins_242]